MPTMTPIKITIYDKDDEGREYTRNIVPWGTLKRAIALTKGFEVNEVGEDNLDAIASFVVNVFGGQFTLEELNNGAEIGEILSVMQNIVARAGAIVKANPTPKPPSAKKK